MEFMSDEEFNRVMDEFDWDAPINEAQSEQELPESCSQSTVEAARIPPCPMTPDSSHGPSTSEPVARVKMAEDPFGSAFSIDNTKRKPTNDIHVVPAEIYYDPEKCIFWDERDYDWTRRPRLSGYRQSGLHQDTIERSASSSKETSSGITRAIDLTMEETEYSHAKSPSKCPTISKSNQTGPIESESRGTDISSPNDAAPSTPNPPVTSRPMGVQSSESLVQQSKNINTDVALSKVHPSAPEQGNDHITNATAPEDPTNTIEQDDGIIVNIFAPIDHASPIQQGDETTSNMDVSKDCNLAMGQDYEIITKVPALKDHVNSTPQSDEIITDINIPNDREGATDQGHEIITRVPASTENASSLEQGDGITNDMKVFRDCDKEIDRNGKTTTKVPAFKNREDSVEQGNGINNHASVLKNHEITIDQGLGNGHHEPTASGTTIAQDSAEMQGIEKTSTVDSTETRLMAVAPKRPQRLFSSAVSLSSIPVRGSVKTRKSVNPFSTWQPPMSGKMSDSPESHTGIPGDISEPSNIGKAIITAPASTILNSPVGLLEGAKEVQSSSASNPPTPRGSSTHLPVNARSTYSPPSVDAPSLVNEIGKSQEVLHEPQAISTMDASTSAEHPVESVDLARSTSTQSASKDEEASLSELEIEHHGEQSLWDEKLCSIEEHAASSETVIDLTQMSSTSEVSTPTPESSHRPEAIHEALLSPVADACSVEYSSKPEAVPEVPVATKDTVGPPKSVCRTQSSFVQFVCTPTEEPVSPLQAAEVKEAQPSPAAEATITVHDHVGSLGASHEGQAVHAQDIESVTEKEVALVEAAHERSEAFTVRPREPTEESGAPLEAAQEVEEHRNGPDEEVSLVESNSGSIELLEPSKPQLKVVIPSPGETLTQPGSRRSSLRSRTSLEPSFQEPVSSLQQPTALTEEPNMIGGIDAKATKHNRTAPKTTTKNKSKARSPSTANRSTCSNTKETSTHPDFSVLPTGTAPLPDDDSALQVKQAKALLDRDSIPSSAQPQANGDDTRLVGPEKASQAELSSEYYDELAMSDPEDSCCTPLAVQLTPPRKHQVHNSKSSPSVKVGKGRKETQSTDTALSVKARKRAKTGPQGRKLVGDRELGGLLMRQNTPDTKIRSLDGKMKVNKLVKKAIDEVESSNGKATDDVPEKGAGKGGSDKTLSRKRERNKSLDLTSDKRVLEKKPRRSGRLSDGVDTTEDVKVAKNDKPRRSGRLVDGTVEG